MTPRSLDMVARVVDGDDEFRARVATEVAEDEVGRAGWLWLRRPEGWIDELAEIEAGWVAEQADQAGARDERSATRKLASVREALARAEAESAHREASLVAARGDLATERVARVQAEQRAAALEADLATAATDRAEVVRNLKATEERAVARAKDLKAARARVRELEERLAALGAEPGPGTAPAAAGDAPAPAPVAVDPAAPADGVAAAAATVPGGVDPAATTDAVAAAAPPVAVDPATLAGEVARAAGGAAALADALGRLATMLGTAGIPPAADGAAGTGSDGVVEPAAEAALPAARLERGTGGTGPPAVACAPPGATEPGPAATTVRRVPLVLPGGVFDDTPEAAEHLLRAPGVVLVVDGYNVSMQGWPGLPVADQRRRLVTGLVDLAARTATRVEVVFDGAEVDPMSLPAPRRPLVRVRFSDPGVEADDVVIDLVASLPAATPVAVASSDRRVREGARRRGANLLHADQILALLRR
jgi:predicted RNA-binding protein with PIN domain